MPPLRISVVGPMLNESQFVGYSIMAVHPFVKEFVYAVSPKSDDGTIELLRHINEKYGKVKVLIEDKYDFDPHDMKAYNGSFNDCLAVSTGEAAWFLHADQVVSNPEVIPSIDEDALAWYIHLTSYAGDMEHIFASGRTENWKNLHRNRFGLHYAGAYGSQNEDFYHRDITQNVYRFHGFDFDKYPYEIKDSFIKACHFCEVKPYERRLEKMIKCLTTQHPTLSKERIQVMAETHPRVSLKSIDKWAGFDISPDSFTIVPAKEPLPEVFEKYRAEFEPFIKIKETVNE